MPAQAPFYLVRSSPLWGVAYGEYQVVGIKGTIWGAGRRALVFDELGNLQRLRLGTYQRARAFSPSFIRPQMFTRCLRCVWWDWAGQERLGNWGRVSALGEFNCKVSLDITAIHVEGTGYYDSVMVAHGREGHGQLWGPGRGTQGERILGSFGRVPGWLWGRRWHSRQGTGWASVEMWQSTSGNST